MALRWYSTVIDSLDLHAQAHWWADTLGWEVIFENDEEAAVVPPWGLEFSRDLPWERVPPGLVFVPVPAGKTVKNRLHIDLAPHLDDDRDGLIAALEGRGARRADVGQTSEATWTVLLDPEGNEFCVLSARDQ